MRLFIAINFEESIKSTIQDIIREIKKSSIQGKFVKNEHMHLTLEFLGEISANKVDLIKGAMDKVATESFTIQLSGVGFFKRKEGNIYWLGIEENKPLLQMQNQLHEMLIEQGFQLENRIYKPHITIGRKVKLGEKFNLEELSNSIKRIRIDIQKIHMMESKQINGKLVHSIVYTKRLHTK